MYVGVKGRQGSFEIFQFNFQLGYNDRMIVIKHCCEFLHALLIIILDHSKFISLSLLRTVVCVCVGGGGGGGVGRYNKIGTNNKQTTPLCPVA